MSDSIGDRGKHSRGLPDHVQAAVDLAERRDRRNAEKEKARRLVTGAMRRYEIRLTAFVDATDDAMAAHVAEAFVHLCSASSADIGVSLTGPDGWVDLTDTKGSS